MTFFTCAGVLSLAVTVVIILIDGAEHTTIDMIQSTPLFLPITSTLIFIGPATFCYTIHYCVLAIGAEELENSKNDNTPYSATFGEIIPEQPGESENLKINSDRVMISADENKTDTNAKCEMEGISVINEDKEKKKGNEYAVYINEEKFDVENFLNNGQNSSNLEENYPFEIFQGEEEKNGVRSVAVSDITGPLGSAYIVTSLLNLLMGSAGYAFYRGSAVIR